MSSALRTFVRTIPGVQVVGVVFARPELTAALVNDKPQLFILDIDLVLDKADEHSSLAVFFRQIQQAGSCSHSIVLVNSPAQKQLVLSMGADKALLKGALDDQLRRLVIQACALFVPPL